MLVNAFLINQSSHRGGAACILYIFINRECPTQKKKIRSAVAHDTAVQGRIHVINSSIYCPPQFIEIERVRYIATTRTHNERVSLNTRW
jgi:hypothetical protein